MSRPGEHMTSPRRLPFSRRHVPAGFDLVAHLGRARYACQECGAPSAPFEWARDQLRAYRSAELHHQAHLEDDRFTLTPAGRDALRPVACHECPHDAGHHGYDRG